jgi:hypothetical protein
MPSVAEPIIAVIITAIITVVSTLGAVFIGAWLSRRASDAQHRQEQKDRETERQRERRELRDAVRTLVNLEIEYNLAALRTFWRDRVMVPAVGVPIEQQFERRRGLIDTPLPLWRHIRWDSLTTELPLALTVAELWGIQMCYHRLTTLTDRVVMLAARMPDTLAQKYNALRADTPPQERSLDRTDLFGDVHEFVTSTQALWSECEELYRELNASKLLDVMQVGGTVASSTWSTWDDE